MNKKILISVIVLIMLIMGGLFWLNIKNKGEIITQPSESVSEVIQNTEDYSELNKKSSDQSDISDWQTYQNEEYGFEVKYPKNWNLLEIEGRPFSMTIRREGIFNKDFAKDDIQMVVGIHDFHSRGSVENNLNYLEEGLVADFFNSLEEISVNGGKGFYWIGESPAGPTLSVYLVGDSQVFLIRYNIYEDSSKNGVSQAELLFNQILSTFKFIN